MDEHLRFQADSVAERLPPLAVPSPLPRPCGASLPRLQDPGWECTGVGLIVVLMASIANKRIPVVLPRRALEIVDPDPWWELPLRDFTGGDHVHLMVPRRPTDFRGDTPIPWGDAMMSMKRVGETTIGGVAFFGPPSEEGNRGG